MYFGYNTGAQKLVRNIRVGSTFIAHNFLGDMSLIWDMEMDVMEIWRALFGKPQLPPPRASWSWSFNRKAIAQSQPTDSEVFKTAGIMLIALIITLIIFILLARYAYGKVKAFAIKVIQASKEVTTSSETSTTSIGEEEACEKNSVVEKHSRLVQPSAPIEDEVKHINIVEDNPTTLYPALNRFSNVNANTSTMTVPYMYGPVPIFNFNQMPLPHVFESNKKMDSASACIC